MEAWKRENAKAQLIHAEEEDRDAVASLRHQPIEPSLRNQEFPKLAVRRVKKRSAHDGAVKQFEVSFINGFVWVI